MIGLDLEQRRPDIDLCLDAFTIALSQPNPFATVGTDATNMLSGYWHSLNKECPGKVWWEADFTHPAIARALKIDRSDAGATYALAPFRLARLEGVPLILAALPAPRIFSPIDRDWLVIETVIAWNPVADSAVVLGDDGCNHLIGHAPSGSETATIHGSPFAFFRALAEARAQYAIRRRAVTGNWSVKPAEPDCTPGYLLIGAADKVTWPIHAMPNDLEVANADAQAINRAMLRQARIPRARPTAQQFRRAA